jgi:uncharacterized membrane protein YhfC
MNILYLTYPINGLLMIAIPIGIGYYVMRKFKLAWGLWWAGSATFILSQIVHIPFNWIVLNPLIKKISTTFPSEVPKLIFTVLLLGISAGIFEEVARYTVYRCWQRDARTWAQAVVFGAGHGGIEAILLGFLVLYTFFQMIMLRNAEFLSNVPENYLSLVQQQIDVYWSVPWHLSLMGAVERVFTIPFHISAAVIVLQTFKRHQIRWLLYAILWHTLVNTIVVSSAQLWGLFVGEGLLGLIAIASIGIIIALREPYVEIEDELPPLKEPLSINQYQEIEVSKDILERTRYN